MPRDQINFRCDREMKIYLIEMGDYSKYVRDLINQDRFNNGDPKLIKSKIEDHKKQIKQLEDLLKNKNIDQDKINEILNYHAPNYKINAPHRSENQRFNFLKKVILPELKKHGFKGSLKDIDDLLINWED